MIRKPLLAALLLAATAIPAPALTHTDADGSPLGGVYSTVDAPFQGAVAMTVGTPGYTAQRSIYANCTSAGSMTVTLSDSSTIAVPLQVGWQIIPFAVTEVNSSTATCTYDNLK